MKIRNLLFWLPAIIATNLLVGWTAYHWKDAVVTRSLDALIQKAATVDRENRELQDITSDLRKQSQNFVLMAKRQDDGGLRYTVNTDATRGGSFAIRTPREWGMTGISDVSFSNDTTEKIVAGYLFTPSYEENVELPYDGTMVLWVVKDAYKDDAGVRAVAGDYLTSTRGYSFFYQSRINDRRECKNNDKICRETLAAFNTQVVRVVETLVPLDTP